MQIYLPHRRAQFRVVPTGSVVSTTDLVSFWKLDEASGTRVDAFGSNDLTDNNTVGQATSLTGVPYTEGADFEKNNTEYLSISDASQSWLSPLSSDFSVSVWVKFESLPGGSAFAIIGQDDYGTGTSTDRSWLLSYLTTTNRFTFYLFGGASFTVVEADTFGAASTGTWYHIVATYDATAQETSIQVDGGTADTLSHTIGTNNSTADFGISLQLNNGVAGAPFDGVIQAAGIWSRVLSDAEIAALANKDDPFYDQF
jgi:hypothetical protein